jgi:hypothetical protein
LRRYSEGFSVSKRKKRKKGKIFLGMKAEEKPPGDLPPGLKKFLEVRSFDAKALRKKNGKTVFPDHTGGNARARLG